jgi:hypothetical protein
MRRKLRLALVHLDSFFPPAHGGAHMLRVLAEGFAGLGHRVRVILALDGAGTAGSASAPTAQTPAKLARMGVEARTSPAGTVRFTQHGVHYSAVDGGSARFLPFVLSEIRHTGTDAVILTDVGGAAAHTLLRVVHDRFDGLLIYYPMTVHMLPAGPLSISPDPDAAAAVRTCRVIVPSAYCVQYLAAHLAVASRCSIPPVFAPPAAAPDDRRACFDRPVAMFNPNAWKGLPVLLGLADARPDLRFLARCAWRTSEDDMQMLRARPNITVYRQATGETTTLYDRASIVLVPSLCHESLGMVPIEAKLRGIPTLSSAHGGLAEAALGVPFSLPVAPITFHPQPDGSIRQDVPPQPLDAWLAAIDQLSSDPASFHDLGELSRRRATEFARSLSWDRTESAFLG